MTSKQLNTTSSQTQKQTFLRFLQIGLFGVMGAATFYFWKKEKEKNNRHKFNLLSSSILNQWKYRNIIRISDFNESNFYEIFAVSHWMEIMVEKYGKIPLAHNKILGCLFYEPSTRTSNSFQTAMLRLGGQCIKIQDIKTSSIAKGETLNDTIRCLECYTDIIALRHPRKGSSENLLKISNKTIPLLNAGDGSGEHPTQAMLDLYTIYKKKKNINNKLCNLEITFIGDLKYGRTVHSLSMALMNFTNIRINFISPKILQIPNDIILALNKNKDNNIEIFQGSELSDSILMNSDILYVTRVQKERFENIEDYNFVKDCYVINNDILLKCKKDMIIMHPLPRIDEIHVEVDNDPRAMYFNQMKNGMYVRMALIALTLGLL